ncbi:hypothetical protein N658DRAFT_509210 [Parathielavia hyrcaniae]|uniref:Allergen Asp f 4 n=1 Tax=Parathielavia hyrcaniae TaxID=113614 RepID=A0AAN6SZQ9_9PEZI|nr:hypothetical protein N658DRAFT_509210 [Parathielavia hyrcaniae]
MQLSNLALLAGVLGAAAHPSGHAHLHRSKREAPAFVKAVHSKPLIPATTQPAASAATSAVSAASASVESSESDDYIPFCGSSSKEKRVTYDQVMYTGNLGTDNGCPWNSNLMVVPNKIAKKYKYVQEYINVASEPYQVICANKMGADRGLTGMFKVEGQKQLIFILQPGETKTVVADENTQGVCAFAPHEVPLTPHGQYAGVWAEFDFGNTSNKAWSGADCSALVAMHYDMDVPGCQMSEGGVDSTILPGGIGTNAYVKGMEELDGIGLNIITGANTITVSVGFGAK